MQDVDITEEHNTSVSVNKEINDITDNRINGHDPLVKNVKIVKNVFFRKLYFLA